MEGFLQRKESGEDGRLCGAPGPQQVTGCLLEGRAEPAVDGEKTLEYPESGRSPALLLEH